MDFSTKEERSFDGADYISIQPKISNSYLLVQNVKLILKIDDIDVSGSPRKITKELTTYNNNAWYLVRIRYEKISPSEVKISYWLTNQYYGSESLGAIGEEDLLSNLELQAIEGSVWFDDIRIYK